MADLTERRVLADKIEGEALYAAANGFMRSTVFLSPEESKVVLAALRSDAGGEQTGAPSGPGSQASPSPTPRSTLNQANERDK